MLILFILPGGKFWSRKEKPTYSHIKLDLLRVPCVSAIHIQDKMRQRSNMPFYRINGHRKMKARVNLLSTSCSKFHKRLLMCIPYLFSFPQPSSLIRVCPLNHGTILFSPNIFGAQKFHATYSPHPSSLQW